MNNSFDNFKTGEFEVKTELKVEVRILLNFLNRNNITWANGDKLNNKNRLSGNNIFGICKYKDNNIGLGFRGCNVLEKRIIKFKNLDWSGLNE